MNNDILQIDLQTIINQAYHKTIFVLGDLMLDEYLIGDVKRVSPEAPVPVINLQQIQQKAGGAANVAKNLKALGVSCILSGIIGPDRDGQKMLDIIEEMGIDQHKIPISAFMPTITKTRVIGNGQQICRIDREEIGEMSIDQEQSVFDFFLDILPRLDAVIISDYGKGFIGRTLCRMVSRRCIESGIPVIVDPFPDHFDYYKNVTALTPNNLEAEKCVSGLIPDLFLDAVGAKILDNTFAQYLLITRGKDGISLFKPAEHRQDFPAVAKQVFDVTGAGDTVIAVFTLALICGVGVENACRLANLAAGIVVGKIGAETVTVNEILGVLE